MDWIAHIRENENVALKEIYFQSKAKCVSYLISKYKISNDDALEIFQASIVILYDNVMMGKLQTLTSTIDTYITSIAINKTRELFRTQAKQSKYESLVKLYVKSEVLDNNEEQVVLERNIGKSQIALEQLGDPCKSILTDFYYKGLDISNLQSKYQYRNKESAKNAKYKCLKRLQKLFRNIKE